MTRAVGIPAALVVLVVLPGLVAGATKEDKPPAKEAALTVNLEGDEGAAGHPYLFAVTADGTPPAAAATLRDTTGLHMATVAPAKGCPSPPRVAFPDQASTWCLQLEDVAKGHELSGAASGGDASTTGARSLKLTVNRRDAFWWKLPFWILLAGFAAGMALAYLKAPFRRSIRGTVLGGQLQKNEEAKGAAQIIDLAKFVRTRLAAGEAVDDLTPKVAALLKNGPTVAEANRKALREALKEHRAALERYPLAAAAGREASREENRVEDFFGADAEPIAHPAVEFLQVVEELVKDLAYIGELQKAIGDLQDPEHRQAPLQALARAELVAQEAAKPADVRRVAGLLDAARDSVETARAEERVKAVERRRGVGGPAGAALPALAAAPVPPLPPDATELGGADLAESKRLAMLMTVLVGLGILLFALFTIKQGVYDSKLTFSSCSDYFTLFSTALASAAVGSLILLFSYWSPVSIPEE
jgi:hypothetical protein